MRHEGKRGTVPEVTLSHEHQHPVIPIRHVDHILLQHPGPLRYVLAPLIRSRVAVGRPGRRERSLSAKQRARRGPDGDSPESRTPRAQRTAPARAMHFGDRSDTDTRTAGSAHDGTAFAQWRLSRS